MTPVLATTEMECMLLTFFFARCASTMFPLAEMCTVIKNMHQFLRRCTRLLDMER